MTDPTFYPAANQRTELSARAANSDRTRLAIARAAEKTGSDFSFLLAQAKIESALDPSAKAASSSAAGLYQFIDSTWLATLDRHGDKLGMGEISDMIESRGGRAVVTDPSKRGAIMALRYDPQASALVAGALANDNRASLGAFLGREPDHSELYLAHFAGAGGAKDLLSALQSNPNTIAAAILPSAARSNRAMFYDGSGNARSVGQFMDLIRGKLSAAQSETAPQVFETSERSFADSVGDFNGAASAFNAQAQQWNANAPSRVRAAPPIEGYSPPPLSPLPSMSDRLASSFAQGAPDLNTRAQRHVTKAYEQLKALGL